MSKKSEGKTKVVKKKRLKLSGVFFLMLLAFGIYFGVKNLGKIEINNISIKGNSFLSDSTIVKEAGLENGTTLLNARTSTICGNLQKDKLIKTCKITYNPDLSITIHITENKPLFYYMPQNKMALSDGTLADIKNNYGMPTLINYVPKKILNKFIAGLKDIDSDIIRGISEIEYSPSQNSEGAYIDEGRFMLSMNDSNTVYVNIKHLDVLGYYKKVYASIGDRRGIYYFDCDFDNYYFEEYK